MENIISSEICRKCAVCCKNFPFVQISHNEICEIERLTGLSFHSFADQISENVESYFLGFKENGDCFFLEENNGVYSCGVYEARSLICRNYPSSPRQKEVCYANRKKTQCK